MITRFLSLAALICSAALFSLDLKSPQDPIFYIVSGGLFIEAVRIVIALLLVDAVFFRAPKNNNYQLFLGLMGTTLILGGVIGAFFGYFNASLKPIDFLMITEAGIILSVLALDAAIPRKVRVPAKRFHRKQHLKLVNVPLT